MARVMLLGVDRQGIHQESNPVDTSSKEEYRWNRSLIPFRSLRRWRRSKWMTWIRRTITARRVTGGQPVSHA